MKNKYYYLLFFLFNLIFSSIAQNILDDGFNPAFDITPKSPQASGIIEFIDVPVTHYTGKANISVPLGGINEGKLGLGLSLNYQTGGLRPSEYANFVGLGWQLNVAGGGIISRKRRGLADDADIGMGFLELSNQYSYAQVQNWILSDQDVTKADDLSNGCKDSQADEFYFSVGGMSGRFSFDWMGSAFLISSTADVVINYTQESGSNGITKFELIAPDGVSYEFEEKEITTIKTTFMVTSPCNTGPHSYTSAWYLTKIISPYNPNQFIEINYQDALIEQDWLYYQNRTYLNTFSSECSGFYVGFIGTSSSKVNIRSKQPNQITTSSGNFTIDFNYLTARTDINQVFPSSPTLYRLDEVIHKGKNGAILQKYILDYNPTGRLNLKSVSQKDKNNNSLPPYEFTYNIGGFPDVKTKELDHYGFYSANGADNLLPQYIHILPNGQPVCFPGVDRSPNLAATQGAALKQFKQPSGGIVEFEYELNEYGHVMSTPVINLDQYEIVSEDLPVTSFNNSSSTEWVVDEKSMTISTNQTPINILINGHTYATFNGLNYLPEVYIKDGTGTIIKNYRLEINNNGNNPLDQYLSFGLFLEAGSYTFGCRTKKFPNSPNGDFVMATALWDNLNLGAPLVEKPFGGLRIKQIKVLDADGSTASIRNYEYDLEDGTSSGVIYNEPVYVYENSSLIINELETECIQCFYSQLTGSSRVSTGGTAGSPIGYSRITEYIGEFGQGGKNVYQYTSPKEFVDALNLVKPYASPTSNSYKTGLLDNLKQYKKLGNGNYELVTSTDQDYQFKEFDISTVTVGYGKVGNLIGGTGFGSAGILLKTCYEAFPFEEKFAFAFYPMRLGHVQLQKTTQKFYGGGQQLNSITEYGYDANLHQLESSSLINSNNKVYRTEYDYAEQAGISCLINDHIIGIPVTTRRYVDGVFQGGFTRQFSLFNGNQCLPSKLIEQLKNPNEADVDRLTFSAYTNNGFPTQVTQMSFPQEVFTWDNDLVTTKTQDAFVQSYEYDLNTRVPTTSTDIDGQVVTFKHDDFQRLTEINSRNGNIITTINYDELFALGNNPSATANQLTTTVIYSDAPTQKTTQTFDGLGRPQQTALNGVLKNEIIYDNLGRIALQTYLPGNFTSFQYDNSPLNRIIKETYPDGTFSSIDYNYQNNYHKTTQTDENGNTTSNLTDILGRTYKIINPLGDETIYEYDDDRLNAPTKIIPPMGDTPNFTYHYTFDERKRPETRTIPQGGTRTYTYYDATDLLQSSTDANNNVLTYFYDQYGRETEKKLGGTTISTNTYDIGGGINIGKTTRSQIWKLGTNTAFTTDFEYDTFGRLKKSTADNHVGGQDISTFTFNHADWAETTLREHTGYENLNIDIGMGYEYDGFGRVTKTIHSLNGQARILSQNAWNNRDQLVRKILGNGLQKIDYQYNNRGWLTRINQPFSNNFPVPDCNGGSSINEDEILNVLDANIYCGQDEENLNYIIQNRFVMPSFNVDCYNPCENTGDIHTTPNCTAAESNQQNTSLLVTRAKMKAAYTTTQLRQCANGSIETYYKPDINTMSLPNKLYRLRLCNGAQAYVFEDELNFITGTYYIVQEEEIQHSNQIFTIKDDQGIPRYVQLNELIHQVVEGADIYINNYQPNQNPCSPQDFACSTAEQTQNEDIFINIEDNNVNLSAASLTYPTQLYRVKLCGLSEVYLFPNELAQFPDNYSILQTIQLEDVNQIFMVGSTFNYLDGDDLFFLELHYDETKLNINANAQKNGNIAFMDWQIKDQLPQSYGFQYDALDRLKAAKHSIGNYISNDAFSVSGINYDKNGNIQSIIRNTGASVAEGCFKVIDDLVYNYNGNQLTGVTDNAPSATKAMGFKPGTGGAFTYDLNGNLQFDPHKQATFSYNHLNLPATITIAGQGNLTYGYNANGTKLSKSNGTETRDYVNGIEYKNQQLEAIYHPEGRIVKKNGIFEWQWHLTDHLGNTRVLFSDIDNNGAIDVGTEVLSVSDYFPFGMQMEGDFASNVTPEHRYLFNGIERVNDFGLGLYTAKFRTYDPAIGRWLQIDPEVEQFFSLTPYNNNFNNPIRFSDPDGDNPITGLIGAGIGAIIGGGIELGSQLYSNGSVTNWSAVGGSALQGGITGGAAGLTMGASLVATAAVAGGANVVGGIANRNVQGLETTTGDVVADAAIGAGLGVAANVAGKVLTAVKNSKWKGATNYSGIKDPKNLNKSTKPTPRQVREMKKANRKQNGGQLRDDVSGEIMIDSMKSQKGVTPPQNEAQVDHINPVNKGGTRAMKNLNLRTRKNNRDKWDN